MTTWLEANVLRRSVTNSALLAGFILLVNNFLAIDASPYTSHLEQLCTTAQDTLLCLRRQARSTMEAL